MPTRRRARVPSWVPLFNPIAKLLLRAGVPMGPEVLLTVRGRKSGLPRSTPVAVAEIAGRSWLVSPWGEVDWARNLRAAGRATLTTRGVAEDVTAVELDEADKLAFFREVLEPYLRGNPFARWIVRHVDGIPADPIAAADRRLVFEIQRRSATSSPPHTHGR